MPTQTKNIEPFTTCFKAWESNLIVYGITDKRLLSCMGDTLQSSFANIVSATDYSPFGAPLAGRRFSSEGYRFGFNSKEKDDETYGDGNAYDFGARIYDARLGRWLGVDPKFDEIPNESPYVGIGNKPIKFYDPDGQKIICEDKNTQKEVLRSINSQALGTFAFNKKGELYLKSKSGDEKKYSKYFQQQLVSAINDDETIIIRKSEKAFNSNTEEYMSVSEAGEGLTLTETDPDDGTRTAKVFYTGRGTTVKDKDQKDMEMSVDEIIMHELVGHGIPNITKPDSGDGVVNENKVRDETHKKKRFVDGNHPELK